LVICSILETTPAETRRRLEQAPAGCGLVEIRGDHLRASEIEPLVRGAGRPVLVTVRTTSDGGAYDGSEEERAAALRAALDAGARYVDVEAEGAQAAMAQGRDASRVILSHHGSACELRSLVDRYRRMASSAAAVVKIVPSCDSAGEAMAIRDVLREAKRGPRPLACFAMGRGGAITRYLAPSWGSWATYGSAAPGRATAPGQATAADLVELHDVLGIRPSTRLFALIGTDVSRSPSPAMHRAGHLAAGIDARYLPLELDDLEEGLPLFDAAEFDALAVTMPFKEAAAARCARLDAVAAGAGAVNTVLLDRNGWSGYNTDGPALLELARHHVDPRGAVAAIVGAGGTARTAASVLRDAGARVTLYNRGLARARRVAAALGVQASPIERLPTAGWDLLVQATPLGKAGERLLAPDEVHGEWVLDAVYGTGETPLIADARARGIPAADGLEFLVAQAVLQFERMTGSRPEASVLDEAAREWLRRLPR
jgi:3-dehydroquinate dehydratase/shikimate dehydrogenase